MDINEIVAILAPLQQIGRGAEGNGNYQTLLATEIKKVDIPVEDFMIGTMLELIDAVTKQYNKSQEADLKARLTKPTKPRDPLNPSGDLKSRLEQASY